VLDNLCNSRPGVVGRIARIAGRTLKFIEGDVRDGFLLSNLLVDHGIDAVFHFAGLKAVSESVSNPLAYYDCNVGGTLVLLRAMAEADIKTLIFSSSATVYGEHTSIPYTEDSPLGEPSNPYGKSKLIVEKVLADLSLSDPEWRIARLRYFNPVGAHESGMIGESPNGAPNNLMPYVAQVAAGRRDKLSVFGNDYPTPDGTGVRDFIHVMDLVEGHVAALDYLQHHPGLLTVNLGTGREASVLELIHAFESVSGQRVPYEIVERRPGDLAAYWADPALANQLLGWKAKRDLSAMCLDAWRWETNYLKNIETT
jgi:UDP-glucose 4-epimerase